MDGMGALGSIIACGVGAGFIAGSVGVIGLSKKVYNYVKGNKKQDSINNKIQSITATIFAIGSSLALSLVSPVFLYIGLGLCLSINSPYIAKLFTKNKETKEKLNNIATIAAASFNTLGLIPLALMAVLPLLP